MLRISGRPAPGHLKRAAGSATASFAGASPESLKTKGFSIVGAAAWRLHEHDEVGSTSDLARDLPPWSAVRAETQSGGRGRFGRVFVSDPGGLWISAVLPAEGGLQKWAGFSLMVGIHLVRMLESFRVPCARLRWPNDLMSGTKKLGGILIEQSACESLVVGFGLNVRNSPWTTDPELDATSTNLARACGSAEPPARGGAEESSQGARPDAPEIFDIAVRTLDALADAHHEMQAGGMAAAICDLNRRWASPVPVRLLLSAGEPATGRFVGLDPGGHLRLLDASGCEFLIPHQNVEKLIEIY